MSNDAWISITAGGDGSGPVSYTVAAHTGASRRMGTITAAGQPVGIEEFLATRERDAGRTIVTAVLVPRPRDSAAFRFLKFSRVKPKGISVLSIAAHLPTAGGRVAKPRVAYGAMGSRPVRALAVERALEGRSLDENGVAEALRAATDGIDPPTDAIASEWYRRQVAPVHLKRLLLGARKS